MSQLLKRLERDLRDASDPVERAELLARLACIHARMGDFDSASVAVRGLRAEHGDWQSGRIHVWLMLAEGLIHWYEDLSAKALDRITRAQVLSVAMKYPRVVSLASAWKSHIEFDMSNFSAMFQSLSLSFANLAPDNVEAAERLAIVLSNTAAYAGEWEVEKKWFQSGLKLAVLDGDRSGTEALQYNRAALLLASLRVCRFLANISQDEIRRTRLELNNSLNLQRIVVQGALTNQLSLCEARMLALEGRFAEAIEGFSKVRHTGPFSPYNFSQHAVDLEIAHCWFQCGDLALAFSTFTSIDISTFSDLDIDDQFVLISMLLEMAQADARFGDVARIAPHRDELRDAYLTSHHALKTGLDRFRIEHPEVFAP